MKKVASFVMALALVAAFFGAAAPTSHAQDAEYNVALIISQGGLGDRSFNDSGYEGLNKAAQDFGVNVVPIESADPVAEGEQLLRTAAESGFDLVITLEYSHAEVLDRIAGDYPDTMFAILNNVSDQPNVVSIMYQEHTASYMAGALAAMVTTDDTIEQTNDEAVIGAIGGVQSSGIDIFLWGYLQGACSVNPDIQVLFGYSNSFGDPDKGREMTVAMNEEGADVVFGVAGGTGSGIIEAAKEGNFFAIGVDSDQDYLAPGNVLTSVLKRADTGVYDTIRRLVEGEIEGGIVYYGLPDGVGLSPMEYTKDIIPAEYLDEVAAIEQQIIDGELTVIDTRQISADEVTILNENPTCAGLAELQSVLAEAPAADATAEATAEAS
jgi:basic membrane protein A